MTESIVTGLVELDFSFFEELFSNNLLENSSKDCGTGTCDNIIIKD